jgi:hypothetical protein
MERTQGKEKLGRRSDSDRWITHSEFLMVVRSKFKQEECVVGGQISSVRYEREDWLSLDLGEPA